MQGTVCARRTLLVQLEMTHDALPARLGLLASSWDTATLTRPMTARRQTIVRSPGARGFHITAGMCVGG